MKKLSAILLLIGLSAIAPIVQAQTTTPHKGGVTATNTAITGSSVSWNNLGNFQASDGAVTSASVALAALASGTTTAFAATNFSFAIPSTGTITGISVSVTRKASGLGVLSDITDHRISIIKGGVIQATNRSAGTSWPTTAAPATFGGGSDAWGTTWTPADINATDFGVAVSAKIYAGVVGLSLSADIDFISISVTYNDITLPVELVSFNAEQQGNKVQLDWATMTETESDYYIVERSVTATGEWHPVAQQAAAGNSQSLLQYRAEDPAPFPMNYYRLKQVDKDTRTHYSSIVAVEYLPEAAEALSVYPVPAVDQLYLQNEGDIQRLEIYNAEGLLIQTIGQDANRNKLDISTLNPGLYLLKAYEGTSMRYTRFIKQD